MNYIDLHTHSCFSDGMLCPAEIVREAKKIGLVAVALTDHDTVDGLPEAETEAQKQGIVLLKGIEVSACDADCPSIHILGLNLQNPEAMQELAIVNRRHRMVQNLDILHGLKEKYNINIDIEELVKACRCTVGSANIMQFMKTNGFVSTFLEAQKMVREFKNKPYGCEVKTAIDAIHSAGGLAFLAHPYLLHLPFATLKAKIVHFKSLGLDGIECFHSEHSAEQKALFVSMAKELNMLISGGSDFHGEFKDGVHLGIGKGQDFLIDDSYLKQFNL